MMLLEILDTSIATSSPALKSRLRLTVEKTTIARTAHSTIDTIRSLSSFTVHCEVNWINGSMPCQAFAESHFDELTHSHQYLQNVLLQPDLEGKEEQTKGMESRTGTVDSCPVQLRNSTQV